MLSDFLFRSTHPCLSGGSSTDLTQQEESVPLSAVKPFRKEFGW